MKKRLESTSNGSMEIKMEFDEVVSKLEHARHSLKPLKLQVIHKGLIGQNKLQFTENWLERENSIRTLLTEYIAIVEQNITDTKVNAEMLKQQDEAIGQTDKSWR